MQIGPYTLSNNLALAPMAGVTDLPFRRLCRSLGAGYVVSEMVHSDPRLRGTRKSLQRTNHDGEEEPIAVQIAGGDPEWLADAACYNVERGAQIIDINMGCPAKKVCNRAAGSALLENEKLVGAILRTVLDAVSVPVTLKIRTGPAPESRNGVRVAQIAEAAGVAALAVHGRTRADRFAGEAEYRTIRAICRSVRIPVFANGDIDSPLRAKTVLEQTGAAGLMIGRGAQGNPWIFRQILHYFANGQIPGPPDPAEVHQVLRAHVTDLHAFYGEQHGLRVARKHFGWYLQGRSGGDALRRRLVRVESAQEQLQLIDDYFSDWNTIAA